MLFAALDPELDIGDLGLVLEVHAVILQVGDHGQDDGFILIVAWDWSVDSPVPIGAIQSAFYIPRWTFSKKCCIIKAVSYN